MDPNLTYPIVLNASINATLIQPPSVWWSSATTISGIISAGIAILGIYLGQHWTNGAERERQFFKDRRKAYYKFINAFSKVRRQDDESLTPETLQILWEVALEAGEYENISIDKTPVTTNSVFKTEWAVIIESLVNGELDNSKSFCNHCRVIKDGYEIDSLFGLIEFLEVIRFWPTIKGCIVEINKSPVVYVGHKFIPLFRNKLLNEMEDPRKKGRWQFWNRHQE